MIRLKRRDKKPARVSPRNLKATLNRKLASAALRLLRTQRFEQPRVGGNDNHEDLVKACIGAARGVVLVARTFGKEHTPGSSFEDWLVKWEGALTAPELAMWHYMEDLRDSDEHGEGGSFVGIEIPVDLDPGVFMNTSALGLGAADRPRASKGGIEFAAYRNRRASEVCGEYIELCGRFVEDYVRDHAALLA